MTVWLLCLIQELLERQLEYERVRLEAESKKATLEYQEKVRKIKPRRGWNTTHLSTMDSYYLNRLPVQSFTNLHYTRHACLYVLLYFELYTIAVFFSLQERLRHQLAHSISRSSPPPSPFTRSASVSSSHGYVSAPHHTTCTLKLSYCSCRVIYKDWIDLLVRMGVIQMV